MVQKSNVPSTRYCYLEFLIYLQKKCPEYYGQLFDFLQDLVKKLIHLPANIIHGKHSRNLRQKVFIKETHYKLKLQYFITYKKKYQR